MTDITLQKLENSLEILSETHRYDLIIDIALKILSLDPQNLYATYELLRAYNNTQQYEKLIESTTRALTIWPNNDILYEFVYLYYLSKGGLEYLKARDAMQKALELNPNNAAWHRNLAEIYLINREPDKAEKYLSNAVKLKPLNAEYRSRLALSQIRLHKVKESLESISKCLRDDPDDQYVLDNAGMVYILAGEIEKAEELFRDALRRFPTYNYFQSHLDWVLKEKVDKEVRLTKGLKYTPLYIRQKDRKRFFDEESS
ncbi:hypothetical protein A3A69_02280 [candidate division WWE3 bacterium RIFCSPLOWO2_01_FULL_37_15]|uniref:Uncharacterized protein n=1 Tax=candidate division WWE3 bacterium RIFCSPLOWO2_01_FULL_37_15 TaxID=1802622 RepID=A0A1F4UXX8_UNCKA|nr:MAG: hypothetical protein A3A69_02280 [candidate division WWE3 bacterium RIFCSPLOWO2_01_FULL_37_15]